MPCFSVVLNTVELSVADGTLLWSAVADIGAHGVYQAPSYLSFSLHGDAYRIVGGKLEGPASNVGRVADRIKQAYSRATIRAVAKKRGWKVVQNKRNPNRLEVYR